MRIEQAVLVLEQELDVLAVLRKYDNHVQPVYNKGESRGTVCPVAQYLREKVEQPVFVTERRAWVAGDIDNMVWLPPAVRTAIRLLDAEANAEH